MDWDDLKTVLAIHRAGSLSGAARLLGLNHSTVLRRLRSIEARLGAKLFERRREGLLALSAGEEMADVAARFEDEVHGLERRLMCRDVRPSGSVRVTTADTVMSGLLAPALPRFRTAFPEIALEITVSNAFLNLTKRDADVAIRPTLSPPETLIGRRVGPVGFAIFANHLYVETHGDDLDDPAHSWIGLDESFSGTDPARWLTDRLGERPPCLRANTFGSIHAAVASGAGLGLLPCFVGDSDAGLRRVSPTLPDVRSELWILTHRDLKPVARVRAFTEFAARTFAESRALLAGDAPQSL